MRLRYLIFALLVAAGVSSPRRTWAQQPGVVTLGSQSLVARAPTAADGGFKVSEDVMLHVGVGTELGYDSNVFYSDSTGTSSSSILRVLSFAELTNAMHGEIPSGLYYDLLASLVYRQYFNTDQVKSSDVRTAFMPTLGAYVEFSSGQQIGLALGDTFTRSEEPPYSSGGGPIVRDTNTGSLQLRWSPGGGRLQGLVRYTNVVDVFEKPDAIAGGEDFSYGSSMSHEAMIDGSWRWFPKTALFVNIRQGYVSYFNPSPDPTNQKYSSLPLHATVGLRGLITEKTSVNLAVGYSNGFYSSGPNPTGFGTLSASVDFSYRPIQTTNLSVGYQHDFQNSLLGNYYQLDGVRASLQQMLFGRLTLGASGLYQNRRFSNAPNSMPGGAPTVPRTDNFVQVTATMDFHVRSWGYIGAVYNLYANSSDALITTAAGTRTANYTKHQILARLGVVF